MVRSVRVALELMTSMLLDVPFLLVLGGVIYFSTSLRNWFLSYTVGASVLVVIRIYLTGRGADWIVGQLATLLTITLLILFIRTQLTKPV